MNQSMTWEPNRYLSFSGERQQPALDLMAAIDLDLGQARNIVDLGCGAGGNAAILRQRFPGAQITGIDSSAEMLAEARQYRDIDWDLADIAAWCPETPVSLIFSNAALHWLPAHEKLFPRLLSYLEPGGVLAVQMPNNFGAPTHQLIAATAMDGPWADKLGPLIKRSPVHSPGFYYGLLSPLARSVRLWQTEYIHVLEGENPVAEWTRGTAVKPFLDALEAGEKEAFFTAYAERVAKAYPPESDGRTLLPFKRMFILAVTD